MAKHKKEKKIRTFLKPRIFRYIKFILFLTLLGTSIVFGANTISSNYLPGKYIFILIDVLVILNVLVGMMFVTKKKFFNILAIILVVLFSSGLFVANHYYSSFVETIKSVINNDEETTTFYYLVPADSTVSLISELTGADVGILSSDVDLVKKELEKQNADIKTREYDTIGDLVYCLELHETKAILVTETVYDLIIEMYDNFKSIGRKIDEPFVVSGKAKVEEETIEKGSGFIVYISGVDNRDTSSLGSTGLSDVNILAAVNPKTHKILLVNIPRDYYVRLHNSKQGALKDKLTHAGLYGINMSINTIEDLFGVKINAYTKFNFKAVTTLVDKIGGITVYSDTAFESSHMPGWNVPKGNVTLNGEKALAYARERYAYSSGDRHRGKNQEAVITAIIKKVTQNKKYLLDYPNILSSIKNYFATNIEESTIQDLVKDQLDTMAKWNVESISVKGTDGQNRTYSWPNQVTYVMNPTQSTIDNAKNKISEVLRDK